MKQEESHSITQHLVPNRPTFELRDDIHCEKCSATFFYKTDLVKHEKYSECGQRPYLCPFCEKPFKGQIGVKKHCLNLHSAILNWDIVGDLLEFVKKHEIAHKHNSHYVQLESLNYPKIVRRFARDFYVQNQEKKKNQKK
eukprot:372945_1